MPLTTAPPLAGTLKTLLLRGLLAGLLAGLVAGGVAYVLGEPHVDAAIAIEEAQSAAEPHADATAGHSHDEEEALVSRDGQKFGLFLATTLAGIAFGVIFAAVVNYARRFTALSGPLLAMSLAVAGWLAIGAVPFFKYPANPPAVGDPDTIDKRTLLWVAAVVLGLLAVALASYLAKVLADQPFTARVAAAVGTFVVVVTLGYLLLPGIDEVPDDFPATLLWEFRISSLATQATLWIGIGIAFALLTEVADRKTEALRALG